MFRHEAPGREEEPCDASAPYAEHPTSQRPTRQQSLSTHELTERVESGDVDTVLVVFTDMQGRLQGKRVHAPYFLDEVAAHGMEGCNYLLAVDVDMNTVSGYEMSSWEQGYGDFLITPDLDDAAPCAVAALVGDGPVRPVLAGRHPGPPVAPAGAPGPGRRGAAARVHRPRRHRAGVHRVPRLLPGRVRRELPGPDRLTRYNVDYSILGTSEDEPLMRDIRNAMYGAGLTVESSKGECNFGQHEIAFRYDEVLRTADNHVVFKAAAKELAAKHGKSLTFMAKYDEREGNSCHVHMSLRGTDGEIVFADGAGPKPGLLELRRRRSRDPGW